MSLDIFANFGSVSQMPRPRKPRCVFQHVFTSRQPRNWIFLLKDFEISSNFLFLYFLGLALDATGHWNPLLARADVAFIAVNWISSHGCCIKARGPRDAARCLKICVADERESPCTASPPLPLPRPPALASFSFPFTPLPATAPCDWLKTKTMNVTKIKVDKEEKWEK